MILDVGHRPGYGGGGTPNPVTHTMTTSLLSEMR